MRPYFSASLVGAGYAVLLSLLFGSVPARALESVTLQLRWQHQFQFAGYYAALQQGYYREAGLEVNLQEGGPGINSVSEVLMGKAEFGIGVSSLVIDYLKGKPVLMLGPVFQHSPNILVVHGRDKRPVDLAGAGRIALMDGDQDVELKAMFADEGIALDKLKFVRDERHLDDFIARRVEALNAYVSNEPYMLKQFGIPHSILKPQTYGMDFYGDVLFTRRDLADQRPELVAAFRAASLRGWRYALEHQDEIVELILLRYNTQHKTREHLAFEARELRHLIEPEVIDIGHSNPGRWRFIAETYARFGLVESHQALDGFFYQQDREVDFGRFYWALALAFAVMLVIGGIAFYIYRVNRRLALALIKVSRSEERHRVLFQTSPSAGIVWCAGGVVTDWNQQAETVFGWKREEVLGRSFIDFLLPDYERKRLAPVLVRMLEENVMPHGINDNLTHDGRVVRSEWFNAWMPEQPGAPREIVSLANDITERVRLEDEIRQLAYYDALTHLPNRRLLYDRLDRILAAVRRDGCYGALMFLDLDNFKPLNDNHGHETGDLLLIEVARRLSGCVRDSDTVARFGGDEFVVLLGGLDADAALARAHAEGVANKILEQLAEPYYLHRSDDMGAIEHRCTGSIGVALFDGTADEEDIFRRSDTVMYCAKGMGRGRIVIDDGSYAGGICRMPCAAAHKCSRARFFGNDR